MRPIRYQCEITKELDRLSKIGEYDPNSSYKLFCHYILIEDSDILHIRVPGGTVGNIYLKDGKICKIKIYTSYIIRTYEDNVEEIINNKFKGTEFDVESIKRGR